MRERCPWLWILGLLVVVTACDDEAPSGGRAEPPSSEPAPDPGRAEEVAAPPAGQQAPAAEPGGSASEVDDASFLLRASAAGPYARGELSQFAITLTPRGEYHVNQEFPLSVQLEGPVAVAFPKSTLERADAAEFSERIARFDVPFTPSEAGEQRVTAKVAFAVCTPENCVPDERTLAVLLPVQ